MVIDDKLTTSLYIARLKRMCFLLENWRRKTAIFLSSQMISFLGSTLVQYAITWYITLTTKSGSMATIAIICGFVPHFLIAPFAGAWADRFDRKKLIMISDSFIASVTLIAAIVFLLGYGDLWILFVIMALRAIGGAIQAPAVQAFLPQLVPQDKLTRVSGISGSLQSAIMIISPMLSGVLLVIAPIQIVFFVDVVTAAIAVLILGFVLHVPAHDRAAAGVTTSYLGDLRMGIKYVLSHKYVRQFFLFCIFFFIFVSPVALLTPLQVTRSFGGEVWKLSAIEVAFASGMLVGGAIIAAWGGFKNRVYTMVFSGALFGIGAFALGVVPDFWIYLGIMALMGLGMPAFNTPSMVMLQEKVEPDYLGRVFGVMSMISTSLMPLSMLVFGPLADVFSVELLLIITGPLMLGISLIILRSKTLVDAGWKKEAPILAEPLPEQK